MCSSDLKSDAMRQRRPHDNPEMTPDLRSHLRSTQGYPEVVRSYVRRRSAKLLFEMNPSFATPEYAAIALTRRSGGLVPACVASASPSYWPAVGSGTPLSIISAPDRIGGYRFYPRMPRLTLREPLSSGPGGAAASSGTSCDSFSGSTGLECLAVRVRAMLRPGTGCRRRR